MALYKVEAISSKHGVGTMLVSADSLDDAIRKTVSLENDGVCEYALLSTVKLLKAENGFEWLPHTRHT